MHKRIDGSPPLLRSLLESAGAEQIRIEGPVQHLLQVPSVEAFFERFAQGTPATRDMLASLDEEMRQQLQAAVVGPLRQRFGDGPVQLTPGTRQSAVDTERPTEEFRESLLFRCDLIDPISLNLIRFN